MIKIVQQRGSGKEVDHIEEQQFEGKTVQSTSRKWQDNPTDYTLVTKDSITLNNLVFTFAQGKDIEFDSPDEQILNPRRDDKGVLHATLIKRYSGEDKHIFETKDCDCSFNPPQDNTEIETIEVTIYVESEETKIAKELQTIESEIKTIEDEALKSLIQSRLNEEI